MTMLPSEVGERTEGRTLPPGTELVITLKINAAELYMIKDPSIEELNSTCELVDSNPKTPIVKNVEDFASWVVPGQQVRWEARRSDSEGVFDVAIESISYAGYKDIELDGATKENFFNAISICSSKDGMVKAKVKDFEKSGEFIHIYNLNFNIQRDGKDSRCFSIDPRLKMDE